MLLNKVTHGYIVQSSRSIQKLELVTILRLHEQRDLPGGHSPRANSLHTQRKDPSGGSATWRTILSKKTLPPDRFEGNFQSTNENEQPRPQRQHLEIVDASSLTDDGPETKTPRSSDSGLILPPNSLVGFPPIGSGSVEGEENEMGVQIATVLSATSCPFPVLFGKADPSRVLVKLAKCVEQKRCE